MMRAAAAGFARYQPPAVEAGLRERVHGPVILAILIGALTFNMFLCLANTVAFPVRDTLVIGCELILVTTAFAMGASLSATLYLILGVFLAYMALIMALRPMLDLKAVRDFLIPIAFYTLGRRYPDPRIADKAALISGIIVVSFGCFEYFWLDLFTQYFNVIQYYIARGSVAASSVADQTSTLFTSGTRPDARNILPFLGPHRVSSVFLEPVSMGNFGAIVYMWALYRREMRWRWTTLATGVIAIIMSDARFGLYVCIAATGLTVLPWRMPRLLLFLVPFVLMLGLAIYGFTSAQVDWQNDFSGRLLWTARLLTSLDFRGVMGISPDKPFLSDSGYALALSEIGLIGVVAFWSLFLFGRENNPDAWGFKALVVTYLCLLLLISDSPFSIKTAALLWFMLGSNDGFVRPLQRTPASRPTLARAEL